MGETHYAVVDPGTGQEVRSYPTASDDQIRAAITSAHSTYREWARPASVADRAKCAQRASELHTERRVLGVGPQARDIGERPLVVAVMRAQQLHLVQTQHMIKRVRILAAARRTRARGCNHHARQHPAQPAPPPDQAISPSVAQLTIRRFEVSRGIAARARATRTLCRGCALLAP